MAIINCPECQTEISDKAENCPKCGFPILTRQPQQQIVIKKEEGCFLQTMNIGCIIILAFIAIMAISVFYFSSNVKQYTPKHETKDSIHNNAKGGSR